MPNGMMAGCCARDDSVAAPRFEVRAAATIESWQVMARLSVG